MPAPRRKDPAAKLRDALVTAMVAIPFMDVSHDRRLLITLVRNSVVDFPDIGENPEKRLHVVEIVLACVGHPRGLPALHQALNTMAPDVPASKRAQQLIEAATLDALLPEEAVKEARDLLGRTPIDADVWRTLFRELDGRKVKAGASVGLVEAFDLLITRPTSQGLPPCLVFLDEISRQSEGSSAFELIAWVENQADRLGVQEELCARRPPPESSGVADAGDRMNGTFSDEPAEANSSVGSAAVAQEPSLSPDGESIASFIGDFMPPVVTPQRLVGGLPKVWGNVPPRNPNFTGREAILEYLHKQLQTERETAVLPQALQGMGGVGKSQVAIEYVHRHRAEYDLIWWIPSERPAHILASLTELAYRLELDMTRQANTAVPIVLDALNTGKSRYDSWLLVFDNAESEQNARQFFPTGGNGRIIITSRNSEWASATRKMIQVDVFTPDESRTFLTNRAPDLTDGDADRLGKALGYLPLAVEQAGSWHAATGMPVDEYLRLLRTKRIEILSEKTAADYPVAVAAAWNVSLEKLERINPAAHQLLQVCSFFAPTDISRDLFIGSSTAPITPELDEVLEDSIRLARCVRDIQRYALARFNHQDSTLQIHRLIQAVLVGRMSSDKQVTMRAGAHTLLANSDPNRPASPELWGRYQMLHMHYEASEAVESIDPRLRKVTLNLVEYLYYWGAHTECRDIAQRAHANWREVLGEDHPQTLRLAKWLGFILRVLGQFQAAAEINRAALDGYSRTVGEEDEGTIDASRMVSGDLRASGNFVAAKQLDTTSFERARRSLGWDDPATLTAAHDLGVSLRLTGEFSEAMKIDHDTIRRRSTLLGSNHGETLRTLNGLTIDQREAGDFIGAHLLQEQVYQRHLDTVGPDNPASLRAARNLAVARRKAGDHAGARDLSKTTAEKFRRRYGDVYPDSMASALNYAVDLRQAGDLHAARDLGETVLDRYQKILGMRHPHTLSAQTNLAITWRLLANAELAHQFNAEAHAALCEVLGPEHVVTLICATNLASDLYELEEGQAAYELDIDTLERSDRIFGPEHPSVLACGLNLALDLRLLQRVNEADKVQGNTMTLFRKVLGDKHPATLNALQSLRADCDVDPMPL